MVRNRTPRNASEYFDAIPSTPVTHIQNSAPGPPIPIAVATPTMLPVPTVAASAVVRAWNWEMSPSIVSSERRIRPRRNAAPSFTSWRKPSRIVR